MQWAEPETPGIPSNLLSGPLSPKGHTAIGWLVLFDTR